MEAKNFEFANTNNALAELSEALVNLNAAVAAKKNDIKAQKKQEEALLKDRENRLEILKTSSENILQDKVLENDGTSNDNN